MPSETGAVVVEVLAKMDGLDSKVRVSASAFGNSMKQIENSANRAEGSVTAAMAKTSRSLGQAQQASRNLGFQISDISTQLAGGQSPFLILAQQGPQVANALDGAKGKVGQFATFLSGPWGAALLGATTLLGLFGSKLFETGESIDDLVDKLKKDADEKRKGEAATDAYSHSLEGLIDKQKELGKQLDDNWKSQRQLNQEQLRAANQNLGESERKVVDQTAVRDAAQRCSNSANDALLHPPLGTDPNAIAGLAIVAQQAEAALKREQDKLVGIINSRNDARVRVREAQLPIIDDDVIASLDKTASAIQKLEIKLGGLKAQWVAGALAQADYAKQSAAVQKQIAELEKSRSSRGSSSLPKVTGREVASILGTTINGGGDGSRSAAKNKAVGGAANSYHLSGQAIDVPLTVNGKPLTKEGIRAELEKAGIIIKELLGPGDKGHSDHFHIAFDKKRRGPDEVAAAQNKAQDELHRQAEEEVRRRLTYLADLASAQGDELDARQALVVAAEEMDKLQLEAVEAVRKRKDALITAAEDEYKRSGHQRGYDEAQATEQRRINDATADLRRERVERAAEERKFRIQEAEAQRKLQYQSDSYAVEEELVRAQEGVARTAKERQDLGRRLLDLQFDEEKLQLEAIIAHRDIVRVETERLKLKQGALSQEQADKAADAEQRGTIAEQRLGTLDQRRSSAIDTNSRQNASPLQSYFQSIPDTADQINEALENVAAGGLATFTDALTDAIVNFKSLGDVGLAVLRSVTAELVKMAIQQVILRTIGKALGAGTAGATAAEAGVVAAAWAPAAALASLATLGTNIGPASAALIGTNALAAGLAATSVLPRAEGGPVFGPGTSTSDSIPAMLSNGEFVIRKKAVDGLGLPALHHMNRTGELPAVFGSGGAVRVVSPNNTPATAPSNAGAAILSPEAVRQLEGVVTRAASAMPDVKLYPTLDPASAMRAGFNSPGGRRAAFEFLSQNSGRVKKSIG